MTSFQLFKGLSGVDSELLIQAEQQAFQKTPAARKRPAKKNLADCGDHRAGSAAGWLRGGLCHNSFRQSGGYDLRPVR